MMALALVYSSARIAGETGWLCLLRAAHSAKLAALACSFFNAGGKQITVSFYTRHKRCRAVDELGQLLIA